MEHNSGLIKSDQTIIKDDFAKVYFKYVIWFANTKNVRDLNQLSKKEHAMRRAVIRNESTTGWCDVAQ